MKRNKGMFEKGFIPWNKGKKGIYSQETKMKISLSRIGIKRPKEFCEKLRMANLGKKLSQETKDKISKKNKGLHSSINTEFKKGHVQINIPKGINHYNWMGGKSFEPYPINWIETLRKSIRERDNFTCQLCGKKEVNSNSFDIHHIDYNKYNLDPNNLITLCKSCHMKTNYKRDYWIRYFEEIKRIESKGGNNNG